MIIFVGLMCISCGVSMTIWHAAFHENRFINLLFTEEPTLHNGPEVTSAPTVRNAWTALDEVQLIRLLKDSA